MLIFCYWLIISKMAVKCLEYSFYASRTNQMKIITSQPNPKFPVKTFIYHEN